jgi:hypothetical protein
METPTAYASHAANHILPTSYERSQKLHTSQPAAMGHEKKRTMSKRSVGRIHQ